MLVGHTILHDPTPSELALVPSNECDREFGSSKRRQQFLCGRSLLRRLLEDWTGNPAASHELTVSDDGKPVCVDGPAVSITHAGDRVACSVAEPGEIGIDLEMVDDRRSLSKIARKFFSAEESDWLDGQPKDRFFMLWTLKEAYVKAIGRSIFGSINRLCCKVTPPDIEILDDRDGMRNLRLYITDGGFLALATTEDSLKDVSIRRWDANAGRFIENNDFRLLATCGGFGEHYASKK